jgi:hypothetical protein
VEREPQKEKVKRGLQGNYQGAYKSTAPAHPPPPMVERSPKPNYQSLFVEILQEQIRIVY